MKRILRLLAKVASAFGFCVFFSPSFGQINVVTEHYNLSRTGANLLETQLTISNVTNPGFGKLWTYPVSGQVYAQPLYVKGVNIAGVGMKNILYVADMHNDVYAFDADYPGSLYWHKNLGTYIDPQAMVYSGYQDIQEAVGICSTPVIDTLTGTMYVEAKTEPSNGVYTDSLFALDITDGARKFGGSVAISASVAGTAYGSGGTVNFVSQVQNQRPALTLSKGVVYLCFASYGDSHNYEGWILGYNASNIKEQDIVYNSNPNGMRGGIWMSGQGPAVDAAGNLYVITGNGSFDSTSANDFGDSFLKLTPDTSDRYFTISDWFTPYNQSTLDAGDLDLGSDGPLLIPGTHYTTASCKNGIIYMVDENNMGHFNSTTDKVRQEFNAFGAGHELHGSTVYWADSAANPNTGLTYWWSESNFLFSFRITNGIFNTSPTHQGPFNPNGYGGPGGILSLSANGNTAGSGILWVTTPISGNADDTASQGYLMAFDASNVSTQLWNSQMDAQRDSVGKFAKFCPPVEDNGMVYVATFSNKVQVYGLTYVLPVNLVSFNATKIDSSSRLDWTTGSEHNNRLFEVERSTDAVSFNKIGTVDGAANSTTSLQYTFNDYAPAPGINFYRLRQVDFDGKATYSRVVSVDFGGPVENDFKVYPNPARGSFTIHLGNWTPQTLHLRMVSMTGETVYERNLSGDQMKDNVITVPRFTVMGPGLYIVYLKDGAGATRTAKVLLLR
jgi:hypothetical protein